jgi:hypothetical protein
MARTRKRDDDSQYNSDATSLAALDASSMSATGSRSSLTFASSKNIGKQRPKKRQRKSLTDALQSISLDKDKGVPEQILKMREYPFSSRSVGFTMDTDRIATDGNNNNNNILINNNNNNSNNGTTLFGGATSMHSNLNSKQQLGRKIDRESGADGDGDVYYDDDDDNSQLTSSTEEEHEIDGMEDGYDDDDDDEEDSQSKKLALMTDIEKAQRKVMLELVFGKDHQESRKPRVGNNALLSIHEVGPQIRVAPILIEPVIPALPSSPPPVATISTKMATKPITKTAVLPKATTVTTTEQDGDKNDDHADYKDPADRKIEELLRLSLKNLREGTHPLRLPKREDDDGLIVTTTPWKTQDDMAIDSEIYSPRVQQRATAAILNRSHPPTTAASMAVDGGSNFTTKSPNNSHFAAPVAAGGQIRRFGRPRSNSLPGGLEMTDATAMDMDG